MKLTRGKRIALELLGPPSAGAIPFVLAMVCSARSVPQGLISVGYVLLVAYALTGIQSILYTAIMEWRFSRGLDPRSWRAVRLSALLGFASGAVIVLAYGFGRSGLHYIWLLWGGIGLVVGFLLGLLIKLWSTEKETAGGINP